MLDDRPRNQIDNYWYKFSHHLPADWRLQRAREYAAHHPDVRAHDHFTQVAVFVVADDTERANHFDAELARQIRWCLSQYHSPLRRLEIESRILAYADLPEAAEHCSVATELFQTYARLCFDLRDRRNARRWIFDCVINGPRFVDAPVRRLLYQHAYLGGPRVVEYWLRHLTVIGNGVEHDLETELGRERELLDTQILADKVLQDEIDFRQLAKVFDGFLGDRPSCSLFERTRNQAESKLLRSVTSDLIAELMFPKSDKETEVLPVSGQHTAA